MALSQLQCLDENHVNPRINESKPDFLYCEDQRLALETLLRHGREAFFKFLESRDLRGFLSDPELETLRALAEPYQPDSELFPDSAEDDDRPLSLHYWPDLSDTSVPQMDLGWPDSESYRGVTRATVYCQPPIGDQAHIKEVVRRMIAQAQKVIAVVMDVFTDVDIFRDLLDVGFKKRVSVYILLDRTALPHFLSMCQRANMHTGHLKHLRVRCAGGSEFYTRSSTRVRGRLGHRFMFIDGDKAVSGSYSFTWMSSRLDGSLVTVVTGQAVETFDKLFRHLYANSSWVDLRQVAMEPEPEKDPLPPPPAVAPSSSAIAMKLYSPKYALALCGTSAISSAPPAAGQDGGEEVSKDPEDPKKKRCRGAGKEEPPPLHPCLSSLEKVCLITFLPTWPEPDPPSDVIGFINIRDTSKPVQAHLQRSEMFETSKVIRFSSPISIPKEVLPEVAKPRQLTAAQDTIPAGGEGRARPGGLRSPEHNTPSWEMQPTAARTRGCEQDVSSSTPGASSGEGLRPTTPLQSSIPPGSSANVGDGNVISSGSTRTPTSPLTREPTGSGEGVHASKMTPGLHTPNSSSPTCAPLSSSSSPLLKSPPNPGSSSSPVPKPRTVQLVIEDAVHEDGQKQQVVSIVRGQQTGTGRRGQDTPAAAMDRCPVEESQKLQNCAEPVREGKPGGAQDKVLGNSRETVIQEVVKEKPKSKQASRSGDFSAAATGRRSTERGVAGFGCQEVTRANRKSAEKPKTRLSGGHALQETPRTAPTEGFSPAPDKANVLAGACTRAHGAALNRPKISEPPPISLDVPPRKGFPDAQLPPPSPPGRTPSAPSPDPRPHAPDGGACTPDVRTPDVRTPDVRTPDVRTPTSDISDECASSRTLSTTSDEYYECSDDPFNEAFQWSDIDERDRRESSTGDRRGEKMAARNEPPSVSLSSLFDDKMVKLKEKERNSTSGPFKNGSLLPEVLPEESRKSPSKAPRLDDLGGTSESKPSSTGDTREEKVTARNDKRDAIKERSKRGGIKETEEQKLSPTPLQPDRGAGPPSPRTIQAPNGILPRVTDNPESPGRPPKPPPPGEGQRQTAKPRQRHAKTPIPQFQTSHTLAAAPRPHPDSQRPTFPAEETQRRVDGKTLLSSTFHHLYSLKEKINKLPAQSKRGSGSSSTKTRKSSG
eukprot:XP_003964574.1 PREDICTED: protein FAM83G-like [Takifugu rubripes]